MTTSDLIFGELRRLEESKTYKYETALQGPQGGIVRVNGKEVVMLASNNYLGLSNHPVVKNAAIEGIKKYGYGVASVRFLCGTQDIHQKLERTISKFVGCEESILFSSCFAANEGFFASLVNEKLGLGPARVTVPLRLDSSTAPSRITYSESSGLAGSRIVAPG